MRAGDLKIRLVRLTPKRIIIDPMTPFSENPGKPVLFAQILFSVQRFIREIRIKAAPRESCEPIDLTLGSVDEVNKVRFDGRRRRQ